MNMLNKILKHKLHWTAWGIMLMSVTLFSAYQVNVKALGSKVFAGRVSVIIPMATCTNPKTCSACMLCGCGAWNQTAIAPLFGKTTNSTYYACKMPTYMPMGKGSFMMGTTILGVCATNQLSIYMPTGCNIWSQWQ